MQQIVSQLIHQGDPEVSPGPLSPWVDLRLIPKEAMLGMLEGQTHRRFMKSHLPLDGLKWDPKAKYIYIGRDGRDAMWSLHNHFINATPEFYAMFQAVNGPSFKKPSEDPRDLFEGLLNEDGNPNAEIFWPFWGHIRSWWNARDQPNLMLVHFNDLKEDLEGWMKKIAAFLEVPDMSEEQWEAAVEHCTFNWMKAHADLVSPPQSAIAWVDGARTFIHKGTNSRWKDALSEDDCQRYEERAVKELGEEGAAWLKYGSKGIAEGGE